MDSLLVLLTRDRDRQAVRNALPGEVVVHFAERAAELRPPWQEGSATAVLVELPGLPGVGDSSLERALEALQRLAPTVPVWLYIPLKPDVVREVVRLAARRLVANVITTGENLRAGLLDLLRNSRSWSETTALRSVWKEAVAADTREIVAACIDASGGAATVADVARQLNKSPRALERHVARAGLPPPHRVMSWCRLLRAMYRLDQPGASVKAVAAELGFPSTHAMVQQLHRHTGLTITGLRSRGGFAELAAYIQAELLIMRAHGRHGARRVAHHRASVTEGETPMTDSGTR